MLLVLPNVDDATRTALAIKGAEGKRLTYRQYEEIARRTPTVTLGGNVVEFPVHKSVRKTG